MNRDRSCKLPDFAMNLNRLPVCSANEKIHRDETLTGPISYDDNYCGHQRISMDLTVGPDDDHADSVLPGAALDVWLYRCRH